MFGLGVGPTNIDLEWKDGKLAFAWMTQLKPTFGKAITDGAAVAAAIGLDPGASAAKAGVPAGQEVFVALNAELSKDWPVITVRKDAPPDAAEWDGKPGKLPLLER